MSEQQETWHFNKNIPIALIFALFAQTAGIVWWASTVTFQINQQTEILDRFIASTEAENLRQWTRINTSEENITLNSANISLTRQLLQRVETQASETNRILTRIYQLQLSGQVED